LEYVLVEVQAAKSQNVEQNELHLTRHDSLPSPWYVFDDDHVVLGKVMGQVRLDWVRLGQ
jgi:hypothetical protein